MSVNYNEKPWCKIGLEHINGTFNKNYTRSVSSHIEEQNFTTAAYAAAGVITGTTAINDYRKSLGHLPSKPADATEI